MPGFFSSTLRTIDVCTKTWFNVACSLVEDEYIIKTKKCFKKKKHISKSTLKILNEEKIDLDSACTAFVKKAAGEKGRGDH